MKVCILALDGLEFVLVKELKLEHLLQEFYGAYPVEAEKYATPALWSSFLTGIPPERFDVEFVERKFPKKLRKLRFLKPVRPIARMVFKLKPPSVKGKHLTIFDYAKNPLPFNVFSYNETNEQFKVRLKYSLPRTVGNSSKSVRANSEWIELTNTLMRHFLQLLKTEEWDLAMTHIYYTDIIGHLFFGDAKKLIESYILMNEFAAKTKNLIGDSILLIMSDHGMKRGIHTNHGFWSSNVRLFSEPTQITDFFPSIIQLLKS